MRALLIALLTISAFQLFSVSAFGCKAPHKRRWYTRHHLPFPCDPTPTPSPTATPSPPAHTPTPTPTANPTPSASPTPTTTPSVSPEPTHTPTPSPLPIATPSPSSSPTITPSPTPNPASAATLSWHASTDPVAGYYLRYGNSAGDHPARMDVGNVTRADIYLPSGNYFFVCTAYLPNGVESKPSNELEVIIQ